MRLGETEPDAVTESSFSVAVLPFRASGEGRHWGDGPADDLIAGLSRFGSLSVRSRASSFAFDPDSEPQQVASTLGRALPSVRRDSDDQSRLRLQVSLIESTTGRPSGENGTIERRNMCSTSRMNLPRRSLRPLRVDCTGLEPKPAIRLRPEGLRAFDLTMRGMHYADKLDPASTLGAIGCFEQALVLAPNALQP
jgi:TolB-like protein